jgi:hypothetical protein
MRYNIVPVAKPRMTASDKWKKRPVVMKYWAFKDEYKRLGLWFPEDDACITFGIEMPKSWTQKKRHDMSYRPHKSKPDLDNLLKGLADAVYEGDSVISSYGRVEKVWSFTGYIEITQRNAV